MSGLGIAAGVVVLLLVMSLVIYLLPQRLVRTGLQSAEIERRRLQNEIVRTAIQMLRGAFFLATTILAWRQSQNSQQELDVNRQAQITERFTRAVDQLGSDELQVRVGGIYALERIVEVSPDDYYRPVVEVLAAFLRNRAPVPAEPVNVLDARATRPEVDIQAAATVLGRRDISNDPQVLTYCTPLGGPNFPCLLDLRGVDLTGADLAAAHLEYANLNGARLAGANLPSQDFRRRSSIPRTFNSLTFGLRI
jgi:Pentapeptide repeats (8 copies)